MECLEERLRQGAAQRRPPRPPRGAAVLDQSEGKPPGNTVSSMSLVLWKMQPQIADLKAPERKWLENSVNTFPTINFIECVPKALHNIAMGCVTWIQYDLLFIQIQSPKLEYIMEILRRVKSSYYSSFKDVCLKVDEGRSLSLFFLYRQKIIIIIKTIFWANNLRPRGIQWFKHNIYKIRETFYILKDANAHSLFCCTSPCQVPRCSVLSAEINLLFLYVLVIAVLEAEDIDLHLRPLRRLISNLEERSFPKVDALLPALFHTLCLIWSRSQHYCTPQHIVVLLQEFCNLIIDKV